MCGLRPGFPSQATKPPHMHQPPRKGQHQGNGRRRPEETSWDPRTDQNGVLAFGSHALSAPSLTVMIVDGLEEVRPHTTL